MGFEIFKTTEFSEWFETQPLKTKIIVEARLSRLAEDKHWGFVNRFDALTELKWTSGLRVYTAVVKGVTVISLLGGNKNGQEKDIRKAKAILKKYTDSL